MKRRVLSAALILALCLSLLPTAAMAADSAPTELNLRGSLDADETNYSWDHSTKVLTLKGGEINHYVLLPKTCTIEIKSGSVVTGDILLVDDLTPGSCNLTIKGEKDASLMVGGMFNCSGDNTDTMTVQDGVKVTVENSVSIGGSAGEGGTITVTGPGSSLTVRDKNAHAVTMYNLRIEKGGSVTASCPLSTWSLTIEDGAGIDEISSLKANVKTGDPAVYMYAPNGYDNAAQYEPDKLTEFAGKIGGIVPPGCHVGEGTDSRGYKSYTIVNSEGKCVSNMTLYATPIKIEFITNGGSKVEPTLSEDGSVAKPADPERDGYDFGGWFSDENCTDGSEYTFTDPATKDLTLYAKWTKNRFTVTFDKKDGSAVITETVGKGNTVPEPTPEPAREGYTFGGWYTDGKCEDGSQYYFFQPVTNDLTLYAKWTENSYTVTFNNNDGSGAQTETVKHGAAVPQPMPEPAREGYTFSGWYTDPACADGAKYDFTAPVMSNLTLYAKWTEEISPGGDTFTVAFITNGGSVMESRTVAAGKTVTRPPDPTRRGYTFDGWYMDAACMAEYDFTAPVTSNLTLYAKWEKSSHSDSERDDDSSDSTAERTYSVIIGKTINGTVEINCTRAARGAAVTVAATPDEGYILDTMTVTGTKGGEVKLTAGSGGKYTFRMPAEKVTVVARFVSVKAGHDCPSLVYRDLEASAWYHEAVDYVLSQGVMSGYGDGTFRPGKVLSRAQLAQILYNRAGQPAVTGASSFADVADDAWCAGAVAWANRNGIVGGYGDGTFRPNVPITREQLAVMLWRYAQTMGYDVSVGEDTNILSYTDFGQIGEYAVPALQWAAGSGVMNGYADGRLDPKGLATRAQTAQMLMRYLNAEQGRY